MRYILSCWRYIVITEVCVLTLTAVDFFNQAHQSSGIEAKLKGAGVQYSTVAPIIPTHPCYCCSVHGVLLHPHRRGPLLGRIVMDPLIFPQQRSSGMSQRGRRHSVTRTKVEGTVVVSINQSINHVFQLNRTYIYMFHYHCKKLFLSNWRNILTEDVIFCTCALYIHFLLSSVEFLFTVDGDFQ